MALIAGGLIASADGAEIHVPADFSTIQAGIAAAAAGDTVTVAPGVYDENIQFAGPDIIVRSTDPSSTSTIATTIIDGGGRASTVRFNGGESAACRLEGFTIRNGQSSNGGGGINGLGTGATIARNVITQNHA